MIVCLSKSVLYPAISSSIIIIRFGGSGPRFPVLKSRVPSPKMKPNPQVAQRKISIKFIPSSPKRLNMQLNARPTLLRIPLNSIPHTIHQATRPQAATRTRLSTVLSSTTLPITAWKSGRPGSVYEGRFACLTSNSDFSVSGVAVGAGVRGLAVTWDRSEGFSSSFSEDRDGVCDSDDFFEGWVI